MSAANVKTPGALEEWLWLGRVVYCKPHVENGFAGPGTIVEHGRDGVHTGLVRVRYGVTSNNPQSFALGWFAPAELIRSGDVERARTPADLWRDGKRNA